MLTVRLESTIDDSDKILYNKLVVFDSNTCDIRVFVTEPFELDDDCTISKIEKIFGFNLDEPYKFIINDKVKNSYSFPFKVFVDITDNCQLDCKHCLNKELNMHNQLDYTTMKSIVEECDKHGVFFVKLGGGEPLLHPNIFEIIKDFSDANIAVSLSTNSYLINDAVAKYFKEYHVKVSVSIEGPKDINDYIRGTGHYDVALNALKILKENDCNVILRVTLTRYMLDVDKMMEMINLANSYGVKLKVSYCRPSGSAIDNELLINYEDKEKYYEIIKLINDDKYRNLIIMDEGMQIYQDPKLVDLLYNGRICGAANRSFHINSSSKVSPCVFLGDEFLEQDSNYESGDIERYWSGEKGTKIKEVRNITIPSACVNCDRLCKYECMATRKYFNNSFDKSDPNCLRGVQKCLKLK